MNQLSTIPNQIGTNSKKLYWHQYRTVTRRHRVFHDEVHFVVRALAKVLETKTGEELKHGEGHALFKVLWRFKEHRTGPPGYPEIDEGTVSRLLEDVRMIFGSVNDC